MLIKVDLATALKMLRGSRTQKEVARQAGLSPSTWNQYEKAKRLPKEESWPKLARGLDCSLDDLWDQVVVAYQERTGRTPEPGWRWGAAIDELLTRVSQQVADRVVERLKDRAPEPPRDS